MKRILSIAVAILFIATSANAQVGNIVTMKKTNNIYSTMIYVKYTGTGDITANSVPLLNDSIIIVMTPLADSSITITTTGSIMLTHLYVNGSLTELNVSQAIYLDTLNCFGNYLTALDVSKNAALKTLKCSFNFITQLDVSKNTALTHLSCGLNSLTKLDIYKNIALKTLICDNNYLTELNVTNNTELIVLDCHSNQLTELDISNNTELTGLDASRQQIRIPLVENSTSFTNPIYYRTLEGEQTVLIGTTWHAYNATVPRTGNTMEFTTNLSIGITGVPFSGRMIFVEGSSTIAETHANLLNIYPNPAQNTLYIQSAEAVEQVNIYDISGRMLTSPSLRGGTTWQSPTNIDISTLAKGIYIIKVKTAVGVTVRKIMIND